MQAMPAGMIGRSALLIIASYACRNETEPAQGRSALGELLGCAGKTHSWKIQLKRCVIPIAGQWEHHRVDLSQAGALYWSEYICTWSEYCGDYMGAHVQDH